MDLDKLQKIQNHVLRHIFDSTDISINDLHSLASLSRLDHTYKEIPLDVNYISTFVV